MVKKIIFKSLIAIGILYISICSLLYFFQEKLIFFPEKLNKDFQFAFDQKFEELNIETEKNVLLNGILFRADTSRGLIFYLHGNGGSLASWGEIAKTYTDFGYDLFLLDYRSYGKSDGSITSQSQLFDDIQIVYDSMKKRYSENKIIVLGYSLGSGLATELASTNKPRLLILQAPYFSVVDMMQHNYPLIPTFILKYKLETNEYIPKCKMPIIIFHGDMDEMIPCNSSMRLKELIKPNDKLFILHGQKHNGMSDNKEYLEKIKEILQN